MPDTEYIDHITHTGVVTAIDPSHSKVSVTLDDPGDECAACPAARLCSAAKASDSRKITVTCREAARYRPGMKVELEGTETMHRRAIMLATVFPCLALVAVMVAIYVATGSQALAALCGLASMIVFFGILYACRDRIAHEFNFRIKPAGKPGTSNSQLHKQIYITSLKR